QAHAPRDRPNRQPHPPPPGRCRAAGGSAIMMPDETSVPVTRIIPLTLERRLAVDRQTRTLLIGVAVLLIVGGILLLQWLHSNPPPPPSPADSSIHLTMGNPNGATDDPDHPDNYLMRKPYFALSYNNDKGTPNWVSWCLKEGDLGNAPRWPQFYPDDELPRG